MIGPSETYLRLSPTLYKEESDQRTEDGYKVATIQVTFFLLGFHAMFSNR